MSHHPHHASPASAMNRRQWLTRSSAGLAGALGTGSLANLMMASAASAQSSDYKALVCIFLYGGNDGLNTIVPTDTARHNQYKAVRSGLHLPVANLVPLTGVSYGLHPALAGLSAAWGDGKLAPVFNVGTLYKPLTKAQFRAEPDSSDLLPDNLYSHSDQQNLWENGTTDTLTRTGWGGRASVALNTANPVISVGGSARFGLSDTQSPLVLPERPGDVFGAYNLQPADLTYATNAARKKAIDTLYAESQPLDLANAFTAAQRNAFSVSDRLGALVKVKPGSDTAFAAIDAAFAPLKKADGTLTTGMARQMYQIAKMVFKRDTVLGSRQVFFAQMGGFDTHGNQLVTGSPTEGEHARLLKELGDALGAFYTAMKAIGMSDAVTAFTQSDFGRTFTPNNSTGTDHAWGNQHLVIGGAVKGGATYGTYPTLELAGPDDVGVDSWERQGRWIPTTSVDQYAATLLGWLGVSDAQLLNVLPNLKNFSTKKLGFV
ncbi:DUF1501 domain-containing protein [Rhizobacter sp. Root1221]|uniref:DUF1501 domain-containing protein n=1 Tax=Rhizobacter sp. Root1221 TaxID=1736433 RepID=UPI000700846D|nr:DUF1501 domain-containing protein [Rhizobacter sp. Root1221]KQV99765.1 hypothetical protein ASC87_03500 [Rhizobacter sp. Root1221]